MKVFWFLPKPRHQPDVLEGPSFLFLAREVVTDYEVNAFLPAPFIGGENSKVLGPAKRGK